VNDGFNLLAASMGMSFFDLSRQVDQQPEYPNAGCNNRSTKRNCGDRGESE
jgi:hypothetical protein